MTNSIEKVTKEIVPFAKQSFEIKNADDMKRMSEILSRCNVYLDQLIEEKEKITRPMNQVLAEVRGRYKPITDQLESIIRNIRTAQSEYQTEMVKIQQLQEAKIASRVKEGRGNLTLETASKKMTEIKKVDSLVQSESGIVKFRTDRILNIIDLTKIPLEYFELDKSKLTRALKAGIVISGATLKEIQTPINFR